MVADYDDTQRKWEILNSPRNNIYPRNAKRMDVVKKDMTLQDFKDNFYSRPRVRFNAPIAGRDLSTPIFNRWKRGEIIEPAKYFVVREVNERLQGHLDLRLLIPDQKDEFPSTFYVFPDSLRSALWAMVLMELTNKVRLRQCDVCGNWKEIHLTRNPFYCGDACKQAAYRKRKKR